MFNILICDDQPDIVNALKIYLTPEGYRPVTVSRRNLKERILENLPETADAAANAPAKGVAGNLFKTIFPKSKQEKTVFFAI